MKFHNVHLRIALTISSLVLYNNLFAVLAYKQPLTEPIGSLVRTWQPTPPPPPEIMPPQQPDIAFRGIAVPTVASTGIDLLNYICAQWDDSEVLESLPFDKDESASEIIINQPQHFVRVMDLPSSNTNSAWIMRSEYIRGLTPEQIRDVFALPGVPIDIVNVEIPSSPDPTTGKNYALWTGYAGEIWAPGFYWGHGGGVQNRVIGDYGSRDVHGTWWNTNYFPTYQFTDKATTRFHRQPIGRYALSYQPMAGSGNTLALATYLDKFIPTAYSDMENVYHALDFINFIDFGPEPLRNALSNISPERYDALSFLETRNALLFENSIFDNSPSLKKLSDFCTRTCQTSPNYNRLHIHGVAETGNNHHNKELFGFTYATGGAVFTSDLYSHHNLTLGIGAAGLGSVLHWDNHEGRILLDSLHTGLYLSYHTPHHFFVDGIVGYGYNRASVNRRITFTAVDRQASSRPSGFTMVAHLQSGYTAQINSVRLTPLARLSYFYGRHSSFQEDGANSLNLAVDRLNAHTLRLQLGADMERPIAVGNTQLIPQVQVNWVHESVLDHRAIHANLALGNSFTVHGCHKYQDAVLANAGINIVLKTCTSIFARYDAEVRNNTFFNSVRLGLMSTF